MKIWTEVKSVPVIEVCLGSRQQSLSLVFSSFLHTDTKMPPLDRFKLAAVKSGWPRSTSLLLRHVCRRPRSLQLLSAKGDGKAWADGDWSWFI